MTRRHPDDRGLAAVCRVREVRETDSRIGLQQVLAEEAAATARTATLESALSAAPRPGLVSVAELVALRTSLDHTGELLREARDRATLATALTVEARARWSADKARVSAVEHLLEQRAARRRAEAERAAAREADDLAAQRWARERKDR